ncbi:hypothetical protein [Paraburkholderia ferrariae]|uniref:hypothetical protein n=1 Tax=Paraburkholderia ferrariae TaxID=386056 RepID=UPI0012EBD428|nr:hypothetical protein [Paraburkholderia ferrariae]
MSKEKNIYIGILHSKADTSDAEHGESTYRHFGMRVSRLPAIEARWRICTQKADASRTPSATQQPYPSATTGG